MGMLHIVGALTLTGLLGFSIMTPNNTTKHTFFFVFFLSVRAAYLTLSRESPKVSLRLARSG